MTTPRRSLHMLAGAVLLAALPAAAQAPAARPAVFSTPTLVDSQLHAGEPSIAVSPVLPADGSRPLIVGDAPWGTSNATSLWWRSRDGGESFELVQDPLAFPRPRPCEEIDGGGDSDTAIDEDGRIYVNDLAALINITVGVSDDDFQTMSCSKPGGTNPIEAVQDRQWIAAAADADGAGPNIDAFLTVRSGPLLVALIKLEIYTSVDGGVSYQPAGSLSEVLLGFGTGAVSQTGNPVVDRSHGPRRGTLYQSYYNGNSVRVGRFTPTGPTSGTFVSRVVANRSGSVANVFPSLAIDTAGNLYAAWVEAPGYDVWMASSTDGGDSWSTPRRVSAGGGSETTAFPYIVAGSPGRVAVLFVGTTQAPSPGNAPGRAWHAYLAQTLNGLDPIPAWTQSRVTDTVMHYNSICTSGLTCDLTGQDRSLLEFNEVAIDPLDGSLVVIFSDNGRQPQPPLGAGEIPQPYVMFTRQIGGDSMLAGKEILDTLPRTSFAQDRRGDATYPKAGTAEGPEHPVLDLRGSRLEATETGVAAVLTGADFSDLNAAFAVSLGAGDPRPINRALWVTRFEMVSGSREEVYDLGLEHDLVAGTRFWYGTPGVARNALLNVKRSNYSALDGPEAANASLDPACGTLRVEIPYAFLGIDPAAEPKPRFHSVVGFALVEPDLFDGAEVYFNNQRTVDATKAYDWTLGESSGEPSTADAGPDRTASVNESVGFDASGSTPGSADEIVCFQWDFGDGATASGATAEHAWEAPGTYVVTLTIVDSLGFASSDVALVEVSDGGPTTPGCNPIDDADLAIEYQGGWHRRDGAAASGGGFHRRMGSHNTETGNASTPTARLVFAGDELHYAYVASDRGGAADLFLDGALVETLGYGANQPGKENPTFGHVRSYTGLGPGAHELVIEHRYGAVYVDGFGFACSSGSGADSTAAASHSETRVTTVDAGAGTLALPIEVGARSEEISVVVEGAAAPLALQLLGPAGELVAAGGALAEGWAVSGLDAPAAGAGTYVLELAGGAAARLEVSVAQTVANE